MKLSLPAAVDKLLGELLLRHTNLPETENVGLSDSLGRVLARDIAADRDGPPFNRAAMDGMAVRARDIEDGIRKFKKITTLAAGSPPPEIKASGGKGSLTACGVEIMTGAAVPPPFDAVLRYEDLQAADDGFVFTGDPRGIEVWKDIHTRGSDFREGDTVLPEGVVIGAPCIAVLASVGQISVPVRRAPAIHLLSTGAELVPPGAKPLPHQIRASNLDALAAELSAWNIAPVQSLMRDDNPDCLKAVLERSLATADILIISGGISKGLFDHVPDLLRELGAEILIHGVAQRPGKPLLLGRAPGERVVIGLPGNLVSCLVNLRRYPVSHLLPNAEPQLITLSEPPRGIPGLTRFVAVRIRSSDGLASPVSGNGSGDFHHLAVTDGFIQIPPAEDMPTGTLTEYPFYSWGGSKS